MILTMVIDMWRMVMVKQVLVGEGLAAAEPPFMCWIQFDA